VRHITETLVSMAATEHSLQVRSSPALIAVSCLAASLARLRQTHDQDAFLRRLLAKLCAVTGLNLKAVVDCVNRLEDLVAENTASSSLEPPPPKASKTSASSSGPAFSSCSSNSATSAPFSGANFCSNLNTISSTPTDMVDISATCVY
jgi:hypothetical protein